ncbi:hypothetical protein PISMIDRAFT_60559, partial [Pisolithus microcarpus 441]
MQRVRATPMVAACGHKAKCPGCFDAVFVLEDGVSYVALVGVWVAQIRVIFKLLDHLGNHPHPLVYVEWFTTLCHKDQVSGLYVVSCSTRH